MNPDREILCGLLAYQLGFVGRDALADAAKAWSAARQSPLTALLAERDALTQTQRTLIEAVADEQLRLHAGDAAGAKGWMSSSASSSASFLPPPHR